MVAAQRGAAGQRQRNQRRRSALGLRPAMWPYPRARPRTIWRSRRNYRLLGQERGTRRCDRFVRDGLCRPDHPRSRRSCEGKEPGEIGQDGQSRLDVRRGGPSICLISVASSLEWGFWMPLTRGRIGGHDNERLAFAFTMMNDDETVQCQISDAAMDELAEVKGTPSIARQAQFVTHRDTIEKIASELFDKAPIMIGYVVRIFSKRARVAFLERCRPPVHARRVFSCDSGTFALFVGYD